MIIEFKIKDPLNPDRVSFWPEGMSKDTVRHDEYLNNEVLGGFTPLKRLKRGDDVRGDRLFDLYGETQLVLEVFKSVPVIVHGQIGAQPISFVTAESEEGEAALVPANSYILESPLTGQFYFNSPSKFEKLYGGVVIPGAVPQEEIDEARASWKTFGF